jgi:hypothetical protein
MSPSRPSFVPSAAAEAGVPTRVGPAAGWLRSRWCVACLALPVFACLTEAVSFPDARVFATWELVLWLAFVGALALLADQRLLNPVQAGALLFYFWFGLGPIVLLGYGLTHGNAPEAWAALVHGVPSLPVVSAGLLLYAAAASSATRLARARGWHLRAFGAGQAAFAPVTLFSFWAAGCAAAGILALLPVLGLPGISVVNFLGAKRTDVWWAGVLDTATTLAVFANVVAIGSIVRRGLRTWRFLPVVGGAILAGLLVLALSSGWKGLFLFPVAYLAVAYLTDRQRPPVLLLGALAAVFLLFLEPFVFAARIEAQARGIVETGDRVELFREVLTSGRWRERSAADASTGLFHLGALFRGIYPLAGRVVTLSSATSGPFAGLTVRQGLAGVVPRAFFPDKPDLNIGNYFSHEIGAPIGLTDSTSVEHSAAISIPFEIAGNFGIAAGLGTFAVLGFVWAFASALLLGPDPARHPLSPWFVLLTSLFESPLLSFLAQGRDLVIVVALVAVIWRIQGRRL